MTNQTLQLATVFKYTEVQPKANLCLTRPNLKSHFDPRDYVKIEVTVGVWYGSTNLSQIYTVLEFE